MVTILKLRAPGMTINRMPLFVWSMLVTAFIILVAIPSLTAAASLLMLDRYLGTTFFEAQAGGDPLLWQHLFWAFGHPEVYILVLPAMGMISEVIPPFSRKPIFGYMFLAWSTVAIGFLGMIVWAHHMFAVGLPMVAQVFFSFSSFLIAVPTSVKIFNWIATMWGGRLRLQTPMLFAIGFVGTVRHRRYYWHRRRDSAGGLAGHRLLLRGGSLPLHSLRWHGLRGLRRHLLLVPQDDRASAQRSARQMALLASLRRFQHDLYAASLGRVDGHARRIWTYNPGLGWELPSTISAFGLFFVWAAVVIFVINIVTSLRHGDIAGDNPWEAWTLEWATTSPPPAHNFDSLPR